MDDQKTNIHYLFNPRSVALIGASADTRKIGYKILENILASGYSKKIYLVNPKGGEICGIPVYKKMTDIEGEIDLATITVPSRMVFEAVTECAKKKVKFLSIITSGFSEVGDLEEERRITKYALEHGMRILGPNIFGIYSCSAPVNATFGPKDIKAGKVAIVTQSGALGIAMIGKTRTENIGLSAIVSMGNKADIDETDVLEYLMDDEHTQVILMYIEGIKKGERFVTALKEATKKKPIIVIKSGRSKRGAMAAASHTGSLAGADEIFSDIMRQCGVLRAESIQEALNWCKFLSESPMAKGDNSVIITNGGGIGVLAADACEKYNVQLYDDIPTMKKIFAGAVPEFGSAKNPVDITGQASIQDYERAIYAALAHDEIHSVICLGCETALLDADVLKPSIERLFRESVSKKPLVFSFFGGSRIEDAISSLKSQGIPIFSDVYEAASCLGVMYRSIQNMKAPTDKASEPSAESFGIDTVKIDQLLDKVLAEKRHFLLAHESLQLMTLAGIPMPKSSIARNIDEAIHCAEAIGYPVVMKVVSKDIIHKSDVGGVALDLENKEEIMDAYQAIMHSCKRYKPDAKIDGVEIVEMVKKGTETIIGARRDAIFGPVIMFGMGGIYVEIMKDVSFRALPLTAVEANAMIKDIKSYPLLLGVRGESKKDIEGIIETILRLGVVIQKCKRISDIEVNPLVAYSQGNGVKAVDARILLSHD
jgi:acetyltransferase